MSSTPRRAPRPLRASLGALALAGIVGALAAGGVAEAQADPGPPPGAGLSASAQRQIDAIVADKQRWTPAERKVAPDLLYARNEAAGKRAVAGAPALKSGVDVVGGTVLVDLDATVTQNLLDAIDAAGGTVTTSVAAFDAVRAEVPVDAVVDLAERNDVAHVRPADEATTNQDPGAVASSVGAGANEAEVTHGADDARIDFGVDGTGQKVCVLSDGVDSLADRVASGDLPNDVDVLAGQAGSGDEGTAMLELIHDIAPGADLGFATAFNSLASFAQNIIDLRADGCTVIVDDITYFVESNMQDGPIAQAVTTVRNDGAIYFSSSSNSGNLPDGTSGTWQGDFDDEGAATGPLAGSGNVHGWGQTGTPYNTLTAGTQRVDLMWADPLAGSANDYDLYGLDAAGANVVRASTATQDGNDDPYEAIGSMSTGQRVAVVKFSGANRFLTTYTNRGRLTFATGGAARGHNASVDAISTAATPAADPFGPGQPSGPYPGQHSGTNVSETFSSDGPVRQFFTPAGVALTPGNFSATGGVLRNGVDITAADGTTTTTPGFTTFFGTSAAAPNAAAIAALALEAAPAISDDDLEAAMKATAIDIEVGGVDPVTGHGIVMASPLLANVTGEGPPGSLYVPITPCRIVDTRIAGGPIADRQIRPYHVRGASGFEAQGGRSGGCGIPEDATAVEASVTAVDPAGSGFFRAWPGDESMPNATFMNFARNEDITNTGSITLADSGADDLKVRNFGSPSQYVIDIQGYYVLPGDGSVYVSISPCRIVDTRIAGGPIADRQIRPYDVRGIDGFDDQGGFAGGCGVPEEATGVEASVTAVDPAGSGFFRAWPGDESMPNATFMNFARNEDITNTGALPLSSSGPDDLKVRNFGSASHYVIDLQGYFIDIGDVPNDGSGALYVPITPCRIVDTRIAGGAIADRQIRPYDVRGSTGFTDQGGNSGGCGVPFGASATETSVTAVDPVGSGFFRAWPGDEPMPNATFMNFSRLQDITNTGSIPLAHGGPDDLKVRNFGSASQYVLDLQGYWQPLPIIT